MADKKARLLGFLILGSLGAIFLPMLFDGAGLEEYPLDVKMPPAPRLPVLEVHEPVNPRLPDRFEPAPPKPQNEELLASPMGEVGASGQAAMQETGREASGGVEPAVPSLKREVPVLDTEGVPVAWTLQLAAFKNPENAETLKKKLIQAGYKSYIRRKKDLAVVFVGPDIQRSELEKLQRRLRDELKLNGLILRFTPR